MADDATKVKSWLLTFVASAVLPFILISYGFIIPPFIKIHKITEEYHEEASALAFEMFSSVRIIVAFGANDSAKLTQFRTQLMRENGWIHTNLGAQSRLTGTMPEMFAGTLI